MSDIAEGLGGVMEGALAGCAVDPEQGEGELGIAQFPPEECANCGAVSTTTFCPQCGQKRNVHRTISAIMHDLIHGVLHLDGKFWKTLPLLIFKPGKLTRRYIDGERAKFVSPMAMFLFSIFAMFAVFQMVGLTTPTQLDVPDPEQMIRDQGEAQAQLLRDQITQTPADSPEREALARQLETVEGYLEKQASGEMTTREILEDIQENSAEGTSPETSEMLDNLDEALLSDDANVEWNVTGNETIDQGIIKKWRDNPGLMLYKLQANGYKFSWLLIPLSIPFMWLIFAWKRRFKAYDHAIFVTYSLSFMSLLFIGASLMGVAGAPTPLIVFPLLIIPPLHIYKQLRGTYELSRFSAFWRLCVMSMFIWIVVGLFVQALLLLGAF